MILDVHDGDTFAADVRLGFFVAMQNVTFRLAGCNAIELDDPGGPESQANLASLLPEHGLVTLTSVKVDNYGGRWDAHVLLADGSDLVPHLIATGWAAAWNGRGPRPVPAWPRIPA